MKIFYTLATILVSAYSFAASCRFCQCTMPLKNVNGQLYCKNHYCSKHKTINSDGKCKPCDLESRVRCNKGACFLCGVTKQLLVVNVEGASNWQIVCKDHYCSNHRTVFVNSYRDGIICPCCQRVKINQVELKKTQEKIAELKKEKAELENKIAEIDALQAQPLKSLFGIKLGEPYPASNGKDGEFLFKPKKQFRDFKKYALGVRGGKVVYVSAILEFTTSHEADLEFNEILKVLDLKYNALRRTELEGKLDSARCFYKFGCENSKNPKQVICVGRTPANDGFKYAVSVSGLIVSEMTSITNEMRQEDADAL